MLEWRELLLDRLQQRRQSAVERRELLLSHRGSRLRQLPQDRLQQHRSRALERRELLLYRRQHGATHSSCVMTGIVLGTRRLRPAPAVTDAAC